jgi:hypothetical protein
MMPVTQCSPSNTVSSSISIATLRNAESPSKSSHHSPKILPPHPPGPNSLMSSTQPSRAASVVSSSLKKAQPSNSTNTTHLPNRRPLLHLPPMHPQPQRPLPPPPAKLLPSPRPRMGSRRNASHSASGSVPTLMQPRMQTVLALPDRHCKWSMPRPLRRMGMRLEVRPQVCLGTGRRTRLRKRTREG